MISRFPPVDFPLLYPFSISTWFAKMRLSLWLNGAAGVLSAGLLVYLLATEATRPEFMVSMTLIFAFQTMMITYTMVSRQLKIKQNYKDLDPPPRRTAELHPRKLGDYLSPFKFVIFYGFCIAAICIWVVAIYRATGLSQYIFRITFLLLSVSYSVWPTVYANRLLQRLREDKFESSKDANRRLRARLNAALIAGSFFNVMCCSLALFLLGVIPGVNAALFVMVLSLSIQALVLLVHCQNWRELDRLDADGYRGSPAPSHG